MRPLDRALLISRARREGEETADVAKRFGVSSSTVRRLESQLDGATSGEVRALRNNNVNLSLHAVIARHVQSSSERAAVIEAIAPSGIRASDLEVLLGAVGWNELTKLGARHRHQRVNVLRWACEGFVAPPKTTVNDRIRRLAIQLPLVLDDDLQAASSQ